MAGVYVLSLLLVLQVATAQFTEVSSDQPPPVTDASESSVKCTSSGYKCSADCSQLVDCISTGQHFQPVPMTCKAHELCDPYRKACSNSLTACPRFQCATEGVFPDLVDCAVFHVCDSNRRDTASLCDSGYAYNASAGQCNIEIADNPGVCESTPVPQCANSSQYGVLASNPSIYYICDDQRPRLFSCKDNMQFNVETYTCQDASLACATRTGNFADPNNCKRYYTCVKKGAFAVHNTCPSGQYFSTSYLTCQPGSCSS
ncbi:peritrophin-48-like isoform X2 [Bacillus rossius redtenbacheri]|uniref:peritrophin-48-like isoform X2 n=1 Tax=Bacillus rossius redtenbacheri TaxID=93214 RepID=UPI002FDDAE44